MDSWHHEEVATAKKHLEETSPRRITVDNPWLWTRAGSPQGHRIGEYTMLGTVLLIILILFLLGALPVWPYSGGWGYYPSGGLGLVLLILIILMLIGRI
jgi:hypothetical protein